MDTSNKTPAQVRLLKLKQTLKESKNKASPANSGSLASGSSAGKSGISNDAHSRVTKLSKLKSKLAAVNSKATVGVKRMLASSKKEPETSKHSQVTKSQSKEASKKCGNAEDNLQEKVLKTRSASATLETSPVKVRYKTPENNNEIDLSVKHLRSDDEFTQKSGGSLTPVNSSSAKKRAINEAVSHSNKTLSLKRKSKLSDSVRKNLFKRPYSLSSDNITEGGSVHKSRMSETIIGEKCSFMKHSEVEKSIIEKLHFKKIQKPLIQSKSNEPQSDEESSCAGMEGEIMEWEPSKEIILRDTRKDIYDNEEANMDWQEEMFELNDDDTSSTTNELTDNTVYFVIDTNVVIRNISLVRRLITVPDLKGLFVKVMIPWQVLKELDKLKTNSDHCVAICARKASKFLFETINNCGSKIIFQKQSMHFKGCPDVFIEVPDDHLIKCCCQLRATGKKVVLLTNDVNLRVKCNANCGIPSEPDSWLSTLLDKDIKSSSTGLHCFECEPEGMLKESGPNCSFFLHKLTVLLCNFLYNVTLDIYKKKFKELWVLWFTNEKLPLKDNFVKLTTNPDMELHKEEINTIWSFYKFKKSYVGVKAKDVDDLGKKCHLISKSIKLTDPDVCLKFDLALGFLKSGNFNEQAFNYISASSILAQNYFTMMETKLKNYMDYLERLVTEVRSQVAIVPNITSILDEIRRHVIVTNEASILFLLLYDDNEVVHDSPEVVIFYKVLLNFLDLVIDEHRLPIFTPGDIASYVNKERSQLNPAALEWLSEVRRRLGECKAFLLTVT